MGIAVANRLQIAAGCLQDAKRSDPMDGFCQLFGVPRWLRQATRLMAGLEVTLSGDMLVVKQVRQQTGSTCFSVHTRSTLESLSKSALPAVPAITYDMPCGVPASWRQPEVSAYCCAACP